MNLKIYEMPLYLIFFISFLIGLSGALSPGPLLIVTIDETIKKDFKAGPLIISCIWQFSYSKKFYLDFPHLEHIFKPVESITKVDIFSSQFGHFSLHTNSIGGLHFISFPHHIHLILSSNILKTAISLFVHLQYSPSTLSL